MIAQTIVHIAAGTIALIAGAAALIWAKGGARHARAGSIFLPAMLTMAVTGGLIAVLKPAQPTTAVIATLTCYLLATSWATARRGGGGATRVALLSMPFALGCCAAFLYFAVQAQRDPGGQFDGYPSAMFFVFAGVAALAALLDLNFILRRGLSGVQRITRHLWRMCTALFIASGSFFLGQQDEFPAAIQGSFVLVVLAVAPLAAMTYWIARVRFAKTFKRGSALLGQILQGARAEERT